MLPKLVGDFAVALTTFITFVVSADVADESGSVKAAIFKADVKFFADQVRPILQAKCLKCHSGDQPKGKLHLTTRAGVIRGGKSGEVVSVTKPSASLLLEAINYEGYEMPPNAKLPQEQIDVLTQWVERGLPWTPDDKELTIAREHELEPPVNEVTKQFWSFQRVTRPDPPSVKQKKWIRNPIDGFILEKLEAEQLRPSPPLDKVALLRRVTYDVTGLPPSPRVVDDFFADESLNAYEKVIDKLLASPHYGEKWSRHWLDLVRYAETNSYERDAAKPNVWRYHDYIIRSLNDDKPYGQFVMEQLAGDELDEVTHESIIATGYYRLGIWQDEPVDRLQELYEDLDDMLRTTSELFLGLTVGCSRCHNHKLDPIPQKDYYRLLAFFHGIDRDVFTQRPIASDQEIQGQKAEIAGHEAEVDEVNTKIVSIEKLVYDDFQPVEKEEFKHEQHKISLMKKRVPQFLSQEKFDEYVELKKQQKHLQEFEPKALDQALCVK